jgi:hypothetical protein
MDEKISVTIFYSSKSKNRKLRRNRQRQISGLFRDFTKLTRRNKRIKKATGTLTGEPVSNALVAHTYFNVSIVTRPAPDVKGKSGKPEKLSNAKKLTGGELFRFVLFFQKKKD